MNGVTELAIGHNYGIEGLVLADSEVEPVGNTKKTLKDFFTLVCYPMVWLMGVQTTDCYLAAKLFAKKTVLNEFLAFR